MHTISTTAKAVMAANLESMAAPLNKFVEEQVQQILAYAQHFLNARAIEGASVKMDTRNGNAWLSITVDSGNEIGSGGVSAYYSSITPAVFASNFTEWHNQAERRANALVDELSKDAGFLNLLSSICVAVNKDYWEAHHYNKAAALLRKSMAE